VKYPAIDLEELSDVHLSPWAPLEYQDYSSISFKSMPSVACDKTVDIHNSTNGLSYRDRAHISTELFLFVDMRQNLYQKI
jgi:hypothetical protein